MVSVEVAPLSDAAARALYERALPEKVHPAASLPFVDALASALHLHPLILNAGGATTIVFPRKRFGFEVASLPPLVARVAIHGPPDTAAGSGAIIAHLEEVYAQASLLLSARNHAATGVLNARGWDGSTRYTFETDTDRLPEDVTAAWSEAPRRTWKKHRDQFEVAIGGFDDLSMAREAVDLQLSSYRASSDNMGVSRDSLVVAVDQLLRNRAAYPVVAYDLAGRPTAGVIVLSNATTAVYWLAGSVRGPAMTILLGNLLSHLRNSGITTFDWAGANNPSIAEFKRRFGPTRVLTPRFRYIRSSILRVLARHRPMYR
ncbi:hypothetical protein BH23BAC4_BH23BAC4_12610 [soil metagenome]